MNSLEMVSSHEWSNALWKLVENHWTINEHEPNLYQLFLPLPSNENIPVQTTTLSLKKMIEISKQILNKDNLKAEERIKIALFLIDAGMASEKIEKVKKFSPSQMEGLNSFDIIELGKKYLNSSKQKHSVIEITYVENLNIDSSIFQNIDLLGSLISEMLMKADYNHEPSEIRIDLSQTHKIIILETSKGKKFIKINDRGGGLNEYLGTLFFRNEDLDVSIPIIPAEKLIVSQHVELLVQPFIPEAFRVGGTLFDAICQMEFQDIPMYEEIIKSIFSDLLKLSKSTMSFSIQLARNDDLFYERLKMQSLDGVSGRIERIYKGKKFKLQNFEIPWETLKTMHWAIDGTVYKETLEELLLQARQDLDPKKSRLIGICHGDWHENNIIIGNMQEGHSYAYIDLERSGLNDIIQDAALFLTHLTIYADYLNPKYSPHLFKDNPIAARAFEKSNAHKDQQIAVHVSNSLIDLNGISAFGTLESRIEIARLFIDYYYKPLIEEAISKYHIESEEFDKHLKSAILLRLLGGREATKWMSKDQMKIIGLIYKSLATPSNEKESKPVIERFIQALEAD